MAEIKAQLNYLRMSPRKIRLVANLIRGMDASDALVTLRHLTKRGAEPIAKLVASAVANAKNNLQLDDKGLYVREVRVGGGPTLKRYRARAFGRAAMIRKRTSHVLLTLATKKEVVVKKKKPRQQGPTVRDIHELTAEQVETKGQSKGERESVVGPRKQERPGFIKRMFRRKAI